MQNHKEGEDIFLQQHNKVANEILEDFKRAHSLFKKTNWPTNRILEWFVSWELAIIKMNRFFGFLKEKLI